MCWLDMCTHVLEEVDTLLTADAVEWCPAPGLEGVLACGTYQLNQQEGTRIGSLLLFNWDEGTKLVGSGFNVKVPWDITLCM